LEFRRVLFRSAHAELSSPYIESGRLLEATGIGGGDGEIWCPKIDPAGRSSSPPRIQDKHSSICDGSVGVSRKVLALALFLVFPVLCRGVGLMEEETVPEFTRLTANGGRVDWYKGPAGHDLIALDAVVDEETGSTELFIVQPDGQNPRCATCDS